ncbi:putative cysteine protease RD19D, partial [Drosera capensis]
EVRLAIKYIVIPGMEPVELLPRRSDIIARQLELVESYQLAAEYSGTELNLRLQIFPTRSKKKSSTTIKCTESDFGSRNDFSLETHTEGTTVSRLPLLPEAEQLCQQPALLFIVTVTSPFMYQITYPYRYGHYESVNGVCGSCWAFSATGAIEGANFIATGKLLNLSEQQQLIDCDHVCDEKKKTDCDSGCRGGLMTNAYKYLIEAGGLMEERDYLYTGKQGECRFDSSNVSVKVVNFTTIPVDEKQIAAHLVHHGPLAVGLNAVFMQTYIGGVSCPLICGKRWVNHGVLLVGYGSKGFSILRFGNKPYWIINNSWGRNGERTGNIAFAEGMVCAASTLWFLP